MRSNAEGALAPASTEMPEIAESLRVWAVLVVPPRLLPQTSILRDRTCPTPYIFSARSFAALESAEGFEAPAVAINPRFSTPRIRRLNFSAQRARGRGELPAQDSRREEGDRRRLSRRVDHGDDRLARPLGTGPIRRDGSCANVRILAPNILRFRGK